ncbi:GNAT family N-acetyltransferase [Acaryochloris thomasi]|uniref:GNAT family N-acetyltransferase n=1 Tax=Acaryochloris thomasi TaxID=2929456 RepID=UPI000DA6BD18
MSLVPEVRLANETDSVSIANLLSTLGYPCSDTAVRRRLAKLVAGSSVTFVAVSDSRIIGLVSAHKVPLLHEDGCAAIMTSLVVDQRSRSKGVGRCLVNNIMSWAGKADCLKLTVTSSLCRDQAHSFYRHIGFDQNGYRFTMRLE